MLPRKNKFVDSYKFIYEQYRMNILKIPSIILIVLSALITMPAFAQNNLKPGKTFRDCPDCPEMVVIPAGSFIMGSPEDEPGRYPEESPQRKIGIKLFAAGKFDITKKEWAAFVKATHRPIVGGCSWAALPGDTSKPWVPNPSASWNHLGFMQDSTHPAVCIGWDDAQDYVNWLSKKTGFTYRLLSEAEWEYAARAGTTTLYSWGDTASHEYANYGADTCCSSLASGRDKWVYGTSPVGSFPSNKFGLYDMNGNVMQWVEDCFNYPYSEKPIDGSAYKDIVQLNMKGEFAAMSGTTSCSYHIFRGGNFNDPPRYIRSASRNFGPPPGAATNEQYRNAAVGFRVARTPK